ncbi:hypothetical protein UG55_108410 [Frankia sp. EI5c]|nr:hypothetical protein UG55_108410 [Frankia sp. EI5c]
MIVPPERAHPHQAVTRPRDVRSIADILAAHPDLRS